LEVSEWSARVWLDDVREAPDRWAWTTTPEQAIELLRTGEVGELLTEQAVGRQGARSRT
jgi:hypothetical protein